MPNALTSRFKVLLLCVVSYGSKNIMRFTYGSHMRTIYELVAMIKVSSLRSRQHQCLGLTLSLSLSLDKNIHQKDKCMRKVGICVQNVVTISGSILNITERGGVYDHFLHLVFLVATTSCSSKTTSLFVYQDKKDWPRLHLNLRYRRMNPTHTQNANGLMYSSYHKTCW